MCFHGHCYNKARCSQIQGDKRSDTCCVLLVGDAFLAMWKCGKDRSIRDILSQVLACAIIIQRNYGSYETNVGVTLRGKTILYEIYIKKSVTKV